MTSKNTIITAILLAICAIFGVTIYKYIQGTRPPVLPDIANNRAEDPETRKQREIQNKLPHISITEARKQLYTLFIDIRPIDAYRDHHITGSIHITEFTPEEHPRAKHLILIHAGGQQPAEKLQSLTQSMPEQFETRILRGGFPTWLAEGLPSIKRADIEDVGDLAKVRFIEPRDLDAVLNDPTQDIYLLDIRTPGAYDVSRIRSAENIPHTDLEKRKRDLPRRQTIYIYGRESIESFEAGALLFDLGFTDVQTLNGGFRAWQRFGYPVEK